MSVSLLIRLLHARSKATRLLEHAESTLKLVPVKLKNQLIRLAFIEASIPRPAWLEHCSESFKESCCQSLVKQPVNTEVFEPKTFSRGWPATKREIRLTEAQYIVMETTYRSLKLYMSFPTTLVVAGPGRLPLNRK